MSPLGNQPDRITAAELRSALQALIERLDQIEANISALREGLTTSATQPAAPAPTGDREAPLAGTIALDVNLLLMSYDDNGHPVYKAKGGKYQKFGVRVQPEILPALGVDPSTLKPGPNPVNLKVNVLMGENGPRKVIGLAK